MADDLNKEQEQSEREEFDESLDDEALLSQIEEWETESTEAYGPLKEIQNQNLDYYHGLQTGVETIRGTESKAVENRIFMATETTIPIATSRLPEIEVRSGDEDEQSQIDADALKDILGFHFENLGVQSLAERFLRHMIIFRYGVFKVGWDKDKDDVTLDIRDPRRIRIPMFGKKISELAFVLEDLELSFTQLEAKFGHDKADKVVEQGRGNESDDKKRKKTWTVTEVWTNELVVWKVGAIILDKKPNPFFKMKKDGTIKKKANFFQELTKPYVIKSLFETEESLIGDTDYIQQLIPIQDNINTQRRQIEDISAKVANPPLMIDSDVMSEEQAANITNKAGQILYGKDAASGKIKYESPGQVPQYLFLDLDQARAQFDNIWGIHSTTRGERQGKETLGGRQLLRAADLGRIDLIARQLERSLDEIAEWFVQMIKLFYTEEKSFSIIGEDGTQSIVKFTGDKVGKNVKPQVVAGSTLPKDEVSIRQEAIQLWQLGAIGIRTLYKRLKLSNIPDAINDYAETVSGRIAQQGGETPSNEGSTPVLPPQVGGQV